jgi:hypothetical protein
MNVWIEQNINILVLKTRPCEMKHVDSATWDRNKATKASTGTVLGFEFICGGMIILDGQKIT